MSKIIIFGRDEINNRFMMLGSDEDQLKAMKKIEEEYENRFSCPYFLIYEVCYQQDILGQKCNVYHFRKVVANKRVWKGEPLKSLNRCIQIGEDYYFQ